MSINEDYSDLIDAVAINPDTFRSIDTSLLDNEEFVFEVFSRLYSSKLNRPRTTPTEFLRPISNRLKSDYDFLLKLLKYDVDLIYLFPEQFLTEKYFMLKALQMNGNLLKYVNEELRHDRDLIKQAARENGWVLASPEFRMYLNDIDIARDAVISNSNVVEYIGDELKNDVNFVLSVVSKRGFGRNLSFFPIDVLMKREVVLAGFKYNAWLLVQAISRRCDYIFDEGFLFDALSICDAKYFKVFPILINKEVFNKLGFPEDLRRRLVEVNPLLSDYLK